MLYDLGLLDFDVARFAANIGADRDAVHLADSVV